MATFFTLLPLHPFRVVGAFFYTLATLLLWLPLVRRTVPPGPLPHVATYGLWGAGLCHTAYLLHFSFTHQVCLVEGVGFLPSLLPLIACLSYAILRTRYRIDAMGAILAPLALLSLWITPPSTPLALATRGTSRWIAPLHIAVTMIAEALFCIACLAAVGYLLQARHLKQKKIAGFFRKLPPLDSLQQIMRRMSLYGFLFFSAGVCTGLVWTEPTLQHGWGRALSETSGILAWTLFGGIVLAGWKGRRAACVVVWGFGFALLSLLGYLLRDMPILQKDPPLAFPPIQGGPL